MDPAETLAAATLQTLIGLYQIEEKRLLSVLSAAVPTEVRPIALFDLEKLQSQIKVLSDELANLEDEESPLTKRNATSPGSKEMNRVISLQPFIQVRRRR
jgi:hypothetical protein